MSQGRSWWRSNRIGLLILVVLTPITIGVTFYTEWTDFFSYQPSIAVDVDRGVPQTYAGVDWRLRDLQRYDSTDSRVVDLGAPPGTDVVVGLLGVDPGSGAGPSCSVRLAELDGSTETRIWSSELGAFGVPIKDGIDTYCDPDRSGERGVQVVFEIPANAGDDLALLVDSVDGLPRYLRFHAN